MRKGTKICLVMSSILAVVGISLCITSVCLGVSFGTFREMLNEGRFSIKSVWWKEAGEDASYSFQGIEKFKFDLDVADVTMETYEGSEIRVEAEQVSSDFECRQDGKTLIIQENRSGFNKYTDGSITVSIPEGLILEEVEFEGGVGSLNAEGITCKQLKVDCQVGEVEFEGNVTKSAELETGVGSIYMTLAGTETDFNYEVESGLGEITVGDNTYSSLGKNHKIDNEASKKMKVNSGVGEITVEFEED